MSVAGSVKSIRANTIDQVIAGITEVTDKKEQDRHGASWMIMSTRDKRCTNLVLIEHPMEVASER